MPEWFQIAAAAFGIAGLAGGTIGALLARASRGQLDSLKDSVEVFTAANEGLRQQLDHERDERKLEALGFTEKLHAQELQCASDISELRGQIKTYESGLAERLVGAVVGALKEPKGDPS